MLHFQTYETDIPLYLKVSGLLVLLNVQQAPVLVYLTLAITYKTTKAGCRLYSNICIPSARSLGDLQ